MFNSHWKTGKYKLEIMCVCFNFQVWTTAGFRLEKGKLRWQFGTAFPLKMHSLSLIFFAFIETMLLYLQQKSVIIPNSIFDQRVEEELLITFINSHSWTTYLEPFPTLAHFCIYVVPNYTEVKALSFIRDTVVNTKYCKMKDSLSFSKGKIGWQHVVDH